MLTVRWNNRDLKIAVDDPLEITRLYSLVSIETGIDPLQVRLFAKGVGYIDTDGKNLNLINADSEIICVGSKRVGATATVAPTKFIEDMDEQERAELFGDKTPKDMLPVGITNLGVTCYLNSVIQILMTCPEFITDLCAIASKNDDFTIMKLVNRVIMELKANGNPPVPHGLIRVLRTKYPRFGEKSARSNQFAQQDACEMLDVLMDCYREAGGTLDNDLFGFLTNTTYTHEPKEESEAVAAAWEPRADSRNKMEIFCGTRTQPVNDINQGLKLALEADVTKRCEETGIEQSYKAVTELVSLPKYLWTQMVRFEWKTGGDEGGRRAKITKKIEFGQNLDLYPYATTDKKSELDCARAAVMDSQDIDFAMIDESEIVTAVDGNYELIGGVTHAGISADAGHYVCFRRRHLGNDADGKKWLMMDDETVTQKDWDQFDMKGGRPDDHIMYLGLWRLKENKTTREVLLKATEKVAEARSKREEAEARTMGEEDTAAE